MFKSIQSRLSMMMFAVVYLGLVSASAAISTNMAIVDAKARNEEQVLVQESTTIDSLPEESLNEPCPDNTEKTRKIVANCSAYTAYDEGSDGTGITASGKKAEEGVTIAMDDVPLGTKVRINGREYTVEDRFGGGYQDRIDIYMEDRDVALQFGRQYLEVEILDNAGNIG